MRPVHLLVFLFISLTAASCYTAKQSVSSFRGSHITIDSGFRAQQKMEVMLLPNRQQKDSAMKGIIGYTAVPLTKAQPECTMGNFIADALLSLAQKKNPKVVASVLNYGGMRLDFLSPGPVRRGNLYEIMPFDDDIVLVDIPGKVLRQFCDHIAAYGGWPVSGITFQVREKKATGILLNGKPVNDQLVYLVAVPDYVANGGDHCDFLRKCRREKQNVFVRDALIQYLSAFQAAGKKINPKIENRITYAQ
jgi:2',3'-cyclic-nucleotide 2'-phosphodiesterase (5'-nucleotidase family)